MVKSIQTIQLIYTINQIQLIQIVKIVNNLFPELYIFYGYSLIHSLSKRFVRQAHKLSHCNGEQINRPS